MESTWCAFSDTICLHSWFKVHLLAASGCSCCSATAEVTQLGMYCALVTVVLTCLTSGIAEGLTSRNCLQPKAKCCV
jgi:hypothetical protein